MVPKRGLEPPHPCEYVDLNHARLPIPPFRPVHTGKAPGTTASPILTNRAQPVNCARLAYTWSSADAVKRRLRQRFLMSDDSQTIPPGQAAEYIPEELAISIRKLAHDLSNALEIIVQTSFLLSTAGLKEPASDWLQMLDSGVNKALDINLALRTYIKDHTPR